MDTSVMMLQREIKSKYDLTHHKSCSDGNIQQQQHQPNIVNNRNNVLNAIKQEEFNLSEITVQFEDEVQTLYVGPVDICADQVDNVKLAEDAAVTNVKTKTTLTIVATDISCSPSPGSSNNIDSTIIIKNNISNGIETNNQNVKFDECYSVKQESDLTNGSDSGIENCVDEETLLNNKTQVENKIIVNDNKSEPIVISNDKENIPNSQKSQTVIQSTTAYCEGSEKKTKRKTKSGTQILDKLSCKNNVNPIIVDPLYICQVCNASFTRESSLNSHKQLFHGKYLEKNQTKQKENKKKTSKNDKVTPENNKEEEPQPGKKVKKAVDPIVHASVKKFECPHCDMNFKMDVWFKRHLAKAHQIQDEKDESEKLRNTCNSAEKDLKEEDSSEHELAVDLTKRKRGPKKLKITKGYQVTSSKKLKMKIKKYPAAKKASSGEKEQQIEEKNSVDNKLKDQSSNNVGENSSNSSKNTFNIPNKNNPESPPINEPIDIKEEIDDSDSDISNDVKDEQIVQPGNGKKRRRRNSRKDHNKKFVDEKSLVQRYLENSQLEITLAEDLVNVKPEEKPNTLTIMVTSSDISATTPSTNITADTTVTLTALPLIESNVQKFLAEQATTINTNMVPQATTTVKINDSSGKKKYPCQICGVSFSRRYSLGPHVMRVHTKQKSKTCGICGRAFSATGDLTRHIRSHTGVKPFKCDYPGCSFSFVSSGDLYKHNRRHRKDTEPIPKNHVCTFPNCKMAFDRSYDLKRHMARHQLDDPNFKGFECEICHRKFSRKDEFKAHSYRHLGYKPHKCHICGKPFSDASNCAKHIKVHGPLTYGNQDKPLTCPYCNTSFKNKAAISRHIVNCPTRMGVVSSVPQPEPIEKLEII